jgi:hypothetical protein
LQELNTGAFSYAVKGLIGAPVADKSGAAAPPSSITITGSIGQVVASSTTPVFDGSVSLSLEGFPAFDATKPISSTNYFTVQAQLAGTLNLTGGAGIDGIRNRQREPDHPNCSPAGFNVRHLQLCHPSRYRAA